MTNIVAINKEQHKNLKVTSGRDFEHVAKQHIVPISAREFASASTSYPVVFIKDNTGDSYRAVCMFGLEDGENLFFSEGKINAVHIPSSIAQIPFALGLDPEKENTLTACVDTDSKYISETEGVALFNEDGSESELLTNVRNSLGRLYESEVGTEQFIKLLKEHDLIHELEFQIAHSDESRRRVNGIFTINEEKLQKLSDETVLDFHKRGLYIPIYAMLASLGQVNRLIQLRNEVNDVKIAGINIAPVSAQQEAANQ